MDDAELVEKIAEAYEDEQSRWITRVNKGEKKPHEVCRFENHEEAGLFSEIHSFATFDEASEFFEETMAIRSATAALAVIRAAGRLKEAE